MWPSKESGDMLNIERIKILDDCAKVSHFISDVHSLVNRVIILLKGLHREVDDLNHEEMF
mgnify:FL=1